MEDNNLDFIEEAEVIQKIYVGPTYQPLGLIKNQVYLNGIPGQVRAALDRYPIIAELIVPVSECDTAQRDVKTKGTHLHHVAEELRRIAGTK